MTSTPDGAQALLVNLSPAGEGDLRQTLIQAAIARTVLRCKTKLIHEDLPVFNGAGVTTDEIFHALSWMIVNRLPMKVELDAEGFVVTLTGQEDAE